MLFNEFLVIIVNKDESKYRLLEGYVMAHFSDDFTGIYRLSKTLKFELRPLPATKAALDKTDNILKKDLSRSQVYPDLKNLLDDYYRDYLEKTLTQFSLDCALLKDAYIAYEQQNTKEYEKLCDKLRKSFGVAFSNKGDFLLDQYKDLVSLTEQVTEEIFENGKVKKKKILHESKLLKWIKEKYDANKVNEYCHAVETFDKFTTCLGGYKETRDNMFSTEEKASSIAYRVINQNMSFFFSNIKIFNMIEKKYPDLYINLEEFATYFKPESFNAILSQTQIDDYNYNCIGRPVDDTDFKGVNSRINEYRQKHGLKNKELPVMKMLYKQILSDRATGFQLESFDNANDVIKFAQESYKRACYHLDKLILFMKSNFIKTNFDNIFIKTQYLTDMAHGMFGEWNVFRTILESNSYTKEIISLGELDSKFNAYCHEIDSEDAKQYLSRYDVVAYFNQLEKLPRELVTNVVKVNDYKLDLDRLLNAIRKYKGLYLYNGSKAIQTPEAGLNFSMEFNTIYEELQVFAKDYDKIRNFATKKPYSQEKIKLNFNLPTLLAGWDVNNETKNASFLFERNGKYYLGIADVSSKKIFELDNEEMRKAMCVNGDFYNKFQYKQISGTAKMFPKVVFSSKNHHIFKDIITERICDIRKNKLYTASANDKKAVVEWIDFMKEAVRLHPEWNEYFTYHFKPSSEYATANEFYEDMDKQSYSLIKIPVAAEYIESLVAEEKLYLFQIYSKDFSDNKKKVGTDNLHTMYWKAIFTDENMQAIKDGNQPIFKLNGEAEIFMRAPSIERKVTHPKNEVIRNKNVLNPKKESTFVYDLIKDKRYAERKYFFHCPITINFRAGDVTPSAFNTRVNQFIQDNKDVCLIGIDRGERHLLYYTVINQKGEILEQGTLNKIYNSYISDNGVTVEQVTDYHYLLDIKEKEKHIAQKSWDTIENIKELKSGYLSQVVHKLTSLMIKYNAIVVLENLNLNFKRSRIKVEKQVYQKFEKAFINKLNYVVFKDKAHGMNGSYARGLQLAAPFESFDRLGKQTGCVYYVVPSYTSHIDPKTGFVNLLGSRLRYENIHKAIEVLKKFSGICYNQEKDYFEFAFDYHRFGKDIKMEKYQWTVCTYGDIRWGYSHADKQPVAYCVTERLKELFMTYSVEYRSGNDLIPVITKIEEKKFLKTLLFYLRLVLQMRYTVHGSEDENDFILSPVEYEPGKFFDSRKASGNEPQNADSNGAYHIALKGLLIMRKIKDGKIESFKSGEERYEWLKFMQLQEFKNNG